VGEDRGQERRVHGFESVTGPLDGECRVHAIERIAGLLDGENRVDDQASRLCVDASHWVSGILVLADSASGYQRERRRRNHADTSTCSQYVSARLSIFAPSMCCFLLFFIASADHPACHPWPPSRRTLPPWLRSVYLVLWLLKRRESGAGEVQTIHVESRIVPKNGKLASRKSCRAD
jgi:hypothetical protein